jgi:hypothetical protein
MKSFLPLTCSIVDKESKKKNKQTKIHRKMKTNELTQMCQTHVKFVFLNKFIREANEEV